MGLLEHKTVVITGGSSGIGLSTVLLLRSEGATVHVIDIVPLDTHILPSSGTELFSYRADVTNRSEVDAAIESIMEKAPQIDVLISNAGISGEIATVSEYPAAMFAHVIDVHVMGAFHVVQSALPYLPDGASIIINSSVTGLIGPPRASAYATAKHAQVGFMKSLAAELAPRGIRVNTVNPGPVNNGFQNDIEERMTGLETSQANASFNELIPLGRHAETEEIAQAMLFLAGPHSKMITSTTFRVDGGMAG
jgi:NAD(P)-dependent dehydrogenase (short-subunit alcohol dehydrogenase family)